MLSEPNAGENTIVGVPPAISCVSSQGYCTSTSDRDDLTLRGVPAYRKISAKRAVPGGIRNNMVYVSPIIQVLLSGLQPIEQIARVLDCTHKPSIEEEGPREETAGRVSTNTPDTRSNLSQTLATVLERSLGSGLHPLRLELPPPRTTRDSFDCSYEGPA